MERESGPCEPEPGDRSDADPAFDAAFSLVAFALNRFLIDHMLRSARLLTDGDLEMLVLWGVLAHQNVTHLMPPGSVSAAVLTENGRVPDDEQRLRPMLLRDLTAITGIPRETARRKLEKLALMRFVERRGRAWVVSTARFESDLRSFTRESTRRMLAAADEVRMQLAQAGAKASKALPPTALESGQRRHRGGPGGLV
jgi:hypothetical protein